MKISKKLAFVILSLTLLLGMGWWTFPTLSKLMHNSQTATNIAYTTSLASQAPVQVQAPVVTSQAYYVATNGNDANAGSLAQPWRTIQKAANTAVAGSTVYVRSGVYNEMVQVTRSGNITDGYLTFQNYPNEAPILDGTGLQPVSGAVGAFYLASVSYITIQGFEIRNYSSANRNVLPFGIYIADKGNHLQIVNNHIHNISTTYAGTNGGNAHGIGIYGTDSTESIHDLTITGNELDHLTLGFSESMALNGNVELFEIANNSIHDNNNIGIDIIGFEGTCSNDTCDQARTGTIHNNTVYKINSASNPAYQGDSASAGIYVDGGRDVTIERNTVYESDYGLELASEHSGHATTGVIARSNLFYYNLITGASIGGYTTTVGYTSNCQIINNTFFENDTTNSGTGEFGLQYNPQNNVFKNNLLYANSNGIFLSSEFTQNSGNQLDNNLYFVDGGGQGTWQWKNQTYNTFAAYKTGTGNDTNSIMANPLLVNSSTPDVHLTSGSPAINAGENLTTVGDLDLDGNPRLQGSRVDIGTFESQPAPTCPPALTVSVITDDGTGTTCGTLSYALSQPITGSSPVTITFALTQGNTITFTGSLTTTAKVKAGITIYGGAFGTTNRIILNGNRVAGDGLHLLGNNRLVNLTIKNFGGREMVLESPGNKMQGVVVQAS